MGRPDQKRTKDGRYDFDPRAKGMPVTGPAGMPYDEQEEQGEERVETLVVPSTVNPLNRTKKLPKLNSDDKPWTICRKYGTYTLSALDDEQRAEAARRAATLLIGECEPIEPEPGMLLDRIAHKNDKSETLAFRNENGDSALIALGTCPKAILGDRTWYRRSTGEQERIVGARLETIAGADQLISEEEYAKTYENIPENHRLNKTREDMIRRLAGENCNWYPGIRAAVLRGSLQAWPDAERVEMQRKWVKARSNATVFDDKLHCDQQHQDMAADSPFARDFRHVEVDDSVDPERFDAFCRDYEKRLQRNELPDISHDNAFRFRLTGRHRAIGVYNPLKRAIAVDPRHPASALHEMTHAWDAEHQWKSLTPEFRPMLDDYKDRLDTSGMTESQLEYANTPAEIYARAAEVHAIRHNRGGSLTKTLDDIKDDPLYRPLLDMGDKVDQWFDQHPYNRQTH